MPLVTILPQNLSHVTASVTEHKAGFSFSLAPKIFWNDQSFFSGVADDDYSARETAESSFPNSKELVWYSFYFFFFFSLLSSLSIYYRLIIKYGPLVYRVSLAYCNLFSWNETHWPSFWWKPHFIIKQQTCFCFYFPLCYKILFFPFSFNRYKVYLWKYSSPPLFIMRIYNLCLYPTT